VSLARGAPPLEREPAEPHHEKQQRLGLRHGDEQVGEIAAAGAHPGAEDLAEAVGADRLRQPTPARGTEAATHQRSEIDRSVACGPRERVAPEAVVETVEALVAAER
jgi:hypothetical protein